MFYASVVVLNVRVLSIVRKSFVEMRLLLFISSCGSSVGTGLLVSIMIVMLPG